MEELGQFLRERREEKGITLNEIQELTHIRVRYLAAIEKGDFRVIPGEVYLRGFLKKYAECVDMDPAEIVTRFEEFQKIRNREKNRSAARRERRQKEREKEWRLATSIAALILVGGVIGGIVYYFVWLR